MKWIFNIFLLAVLMTTHTLASIKSSAGEANRSAEISILYNGMATNISATNKDAKIALVTVANENLIPCRSRHCSAHCVYILPHISLNFPARLQDAAWPGVDTGDPQSTPRHLRPPIA